MKIRKADIRDVDIIVNIESNNGYKWGMDKEKTDKMIRKLFTDKNCEFYILEVNNEPIGYFGLSFDKKNKNPNRCKHRGIFNPPNGKKKTQQGCEVLDPFEGNKICYSDFTAVIKSQQGKGYASLLKKKSILIARRNNCKCIESTVWAKNFKMIGLNNKFGFYVYDIKKNFYPNGDSKLVMMKELR